jgi:hypothetical protein
MPFSLAALESTAYTQRTMKYLAYTVAAFILCAGLLGIVAPERLLSLRHAIASQTGLFVVAVARIAIGIVLIMNAPASRAPKLLQYAGALVLLAGLATPLFGVERTRAVLDWEAAQRPVFVRLAGVAIVTIGAVFAVILTPRRRAPHAN